MTRVTKGVQKTLSRSVKEKFRAQKYIFVTSTTFSLSSLIHLILFLSFVAMCSFVALDSLNQFISSKQTDFVVPPGYEVNNWLFNKDLLVKKDRQRDAPQSEIKTILMWNDAYGVRTYDIGHGREPFYKYRCPETRCYATANRTYLKSVEDFDAVLIHQRGIEWRDMPKRRSSKQWWIQWVFESPAYLYMDINYLNGLFNWTFTYKSTSDFYLPHGVVKKIRDHPEGQELKNYIKEFGRKNKHLAKGKSDFKAAWFVSHCATQSRREKYAKLMKKSMDVDIYGKCGPFKCDRSANETQCYINMAKKYRFYLSFENSICDDYVTEKFFNILKYNVIPIVYGGANYSRIAPYKSFINALDFGSPRKLTKFLESIQKDDAKYAEYFWWKDFYEVRSSSYDRAQAYCDLCKRLHDQNEPPKVYKNMFNWWVKDSHCKRLRTSFFTQNY